MNDSSRKEVVIWALRSNLDRSNSNNVVNLLDK